MSNKFSLSCVKVMRLVLAAMMAVWVLIPAPSQAVPVCLDDLCFEVPSPPKNLYEVRQVDLNADGLKDLYVTGKAQRRAVGDFALIQTAGQNFTLVADPDFTQRAMGSTAPLTSVSVYRTDLSGDGLFDFYIENVDEVIPNARDLIVLTQYKTGSKTARVIKVDDSFLGLVDEIEAVWRDFDYYEQIYRGTVCTQVVYYVPVYVGNPYGYGSPADAYGSGASGYYYGGYTWLAYVATQCVPGSALYTPLGQRFMGSMLAATGTAEVFGQVFTNPWLDRVFARAATLNRQVIFRAVSQALRTGSRALKLYRIGAFEVATGLIVDDVTVVGVADDEIAAGIVLTVLGAYVVDGALQVLANTADTLAGPDVGPRAGQIASEGQYATSERLTGAAYQTAAGTYALPPNCQDESQMRTGQTVTPNTSSDHLRGNLRRAGCGECPDNSAAHHIAPRTVPGSNWDKVRSIMAANNIDIDDAVNGVCLPTDENRAGTSAFRHRAGGNLHDNDVAGASLRSILEQIEANVPAGPARQAALRQAFRDVAKDLTYGREFWRF